MNWPGGKKQAQGRKPVKARLLFADDVAHRFSSFELAEPETAERKAASGYQFGPSVLSDTELPEGLPEGLLALIRDFDDFRASRNARPLRLRKVVSRNRAHAQA